MQTLNLYWHNINCMVNIFRYVRCLVWRSWQASSIATPEAKKWHTEDSGIPWSTQQDKPSVKPDESNECIKSTCQQVCIMFHDFMTWKSPVLILIELSWIHQCLLNMRLFILLFWWQNVANWYNCLLTCIYIDSWSTLTFLSLIK